MIYFKSINSFTSKVIDFFVDDHEFVDQDGENKIRRAKFDNPKALVVLAEEEIVFVDLRSERWPQFRLSHLSSIHSSGITSCQHYSDVPQDVYQSLLDAGIKQNQGKYSSLSWPILGGNFPVEPIESEKFSRTNDILITGHEDGSVSLWDASGVTLTHILTVNTRKLFIATD